MVSSRGRIITTHLNQIRQIARCSSIRQGSAGVSVTSWTHSHWIRRKVFIRLSWRATQVTQPSSHCSWSKSSSFTATSKPISARGATSSSCASAPMTTMNRLTHSGFRTWRLLLFLFVRAVFSRHDADEMVSFIFRSYGRLFFISTSRRACPPHRMDAHNPSTHWSFRRCIDSKNSSKLWFLGPSLSFVISYTSFRCGFEIIRRAQQVQQIIHLNLSFLERSSRDAYSDCLQALASNMIEFPKTWVRYLY